MARGQELEAWVPVFCRTSGSQWVCGRKKRANQKLPIGRLCNFYLQLLFHGTHWLNSIHSLFNWRWAQLTQMYAPMRSVYGEAILSERAAVSLFKEAIFFKRHGRVGPAY